MKTMGTDIPLYNTGNLPVRYALMVKNDMMSFPEINHWHDDMEFICVNKGKVSISVNGKTYEIYEGQMLFINSGQMHYALNNQEESWMYRQITIHPDLIFSNEYSKEYYEELCGEHAAPFLVFSSGSNRQKVIIDKVMQVFEHLYKGNDPLDIISETSKLASLMVNFLESRPSAKEKKDKDLMAMFKMVSAIQMGYKDKLPLNDIARAGGIGRSKCCELFRSYWDLSPNDYLNLYRLSKSALLFRNDKLPIGEIAKECGFAGASYYAETFKKVMGLSPTDYKKKTSVKSFANSDV